MGCNASKETKKKEDCGGGGIIMADDKEKEKEQGDSLMYKFVLIGDKDVGKTTLIVRYTELVYRQPPASLNVDFVRFFPFLFFLAYTPKCLLPRKQNHSQLTINM
eukprot:TRINITY_DN4837_c0_g1_i2.p2 TRINITY_DN4837_c0_g1~~TRINITY_DN4837_c0_g1_i2.p2  ORF type:complete len:105 (-),score=12.52 TRINITY_DN4837_c0_g1_i2:502-816(-)